MHQTGYEEAVGVQAPVIGLGLWYDAEKLILEGIYLDELSAYRARRSWIKTFERNFLLEEIHDFKVGVVFDRDEYRYHVKCTFLSACGRYAFWRLTHHQAPEVQFSLETAHLPHVTRVRVEEFELGPELASIDHSLLSAQQEETPDANEGSSAFTLVARRARNYLGKASTWFSRILHR